MRPTPAIGQISKCCIAASPKQPFNTLCSIFVGQRAAQRTKLAFAAPRMNPNSVNRADHGFFPTNYRLRLLNGLEPCMMNPKISSNEPRNNSLNSIDPCINTSDADLALFESFFGFKKLCHLADQVQAMIANCQFH